MRRSDLNLNLVLLQDNLYSFKCQFLSVMIRSSAGHRRVRTTRPPSMLLLMMAVLEDIFPLDLCTPSTCHLADTSACIHTTSWMQQSGVYRRQKASRLIVVSGELVALSSLAQHRCRSTGHAIASPRRWSKTGHTVLRSWYRYATRWLTRLVPFLTRVRAPPAARVHELLLNARY